MIRIDGYPIDLALSEKLTYEADVTELEVEKGADVTDHIRPKFPVLEIDGIVSDTPIGAIANDPTRQAQALTASRAAYEKLRTVFEAGTTISVECSYGKFDDMVLQNLSPERDYKTLKAFKFTATFKKIKFITNLRTTVRVMVPNCGGRENFGLSLDKLVDGNKILWRKGKPPGLSPATDPKGVIIGQETVFIVKGVYYHQDRKTKLTTQNNLDLAKDLTRDASLMQRRAFKRDEDKIASIDDRLNRADALLAEKERHPGQYVDPAAFGFKPKGTEMPVVIPFRPAVGAYTFGVILRNNEYVFDVRWNSRGNGFVDGAWRGAYFFDVRRIDRTPIVLGIKLVLGVYFGRRSSDPLFADGAMVARPVTDDRREPEFTDAGTRVEVWYFTRDELVEEITSALTGGA